MTLLSAPQGSDVSPYGFDTIIGHGQRRKQAHDEHHDWIWVRRFRASPSLFGVVLPSVWPFFASFCPYFGQDPYWRFTRIKPNIFMALHAICRSTQARSSRRRYRGAERLWRDKPHEYRHLRAPTEFFSV